MLNKILQPNTRTKLFFFITVSVFMACVKSAPNSEEQRLNEIDNSEKSNSVSIVNGKYKVDNNVIMHGKNKRPLLADLNAEHLTDKKTKEEIPDFIKAFLDSITNDRNFEIANPGQEWRIPSITDFAGLGLLKVSGKEDKSITTVSPREGENLPTKQLVYFGIGKNIALLSYNTGGLSISGGTRILQNMTILKFHGNKIIDFWYGSSLDFVTTKTQIIKTLNSNRMDGC